MAKYRKIDPRIWNDEKFRALSDNGKLAFLFLLTHPHMTGLGAMRATLDGLAAELDWTSKAFREAFLEAYWKALVKVDEKASYIGIPNFIKYNRPESPNVVKSWAIMLDLIPECRHKYELIQQVKAFTEGLGEAFFKALPEGFLKALPYQEQEQEQEQEQDIKPPTVPLEKKTKKQKAKAGDNSYTEDFETFWQNYPRRPGDAKRAAFVQWKARLNAGMDPGVLIRACKNYAAWCAREGIVGPLLKNGETFLGPHERWEPYQDGVPEAAEKPKPETNSETVSRKYKEKHGFGSGESK